MHEQTQTQELETQLEDERAHSVTLRGEIAEAENKASEAVGLVANERSELASKLEASELKVRGCVCMHLCALWVFRHAAVLHSLIHIALYCTVLPLAHTCRSRTCKLATKP